MDPSDPNANAFYENINRVSKLKESQPNEEIIEEELPDDNNNEEDK